MIARRLLVSSLASAQERKAILDSALLLNSVLTFAVVMAGWFYRLIEVDISRLAWMFFAYTGLQLLGSIATDQLRSRVGLTAWMAVASCAAVLFLSVAWFFAGGVKNPLFLMSMLVPVTVVGAIQTRLVLLVAPLSVLAATVSALAQSQELLWTVERFGLWIPFRGSSLESGRSDPLPGVETTPSFVMMVLLLFALAQLGVAWLSRNVAARMIALTERLLGSAGHGVSATGVTQASLVAATSPTVIVYSDSGQIRLASRSFLNQMLVREGEVDGKTLFEVISFDDEPRLREALKNGGNLTVAYRVGAERRVAAASVHVFHSEGDTFSSVRLDEASTPDHEEVPADHQEPRWTGPLRF